MARRALLLVFLLSACGEDLGTAPTVTGVALSRTEVRRGIEFFVSAGVSDPDGDLEDARATFSLVSVEGDTELEASVVAWDVDRLRTEIDLVAGLLLLGFADVGPYDLTVDVEDAAHHRSTPVVVRLVVER